MNTERALRDHLVTLLDSDNAHLKFDAVVAGFPRAHYGTRPEGSPHSGWELLEHLRITQWDILEFTRDAKHVSPEWPAGYWPASPEPLDEQAWDESVAAFRRDLQSMIAIARDESVDLYKPIPHGDGQTVLREILLTADHNAYHLGQLMLVRRMVENS